MITVFSTLIALIVASVPIGVAIGLTAAIFVFFSGVSLAIVPLNMFTGTEDFVFIAMPLFMIAGEMMNRAGLASKLIDMATAFVGHVRGGLAMVNVTASMIFAEISGSAVADVAALGSIMIPQMVRRGYPLAFATAIVSASASIAIIIPPSLAFILYGALAGVSVVRLFIAGFIPGILVGIFLMIFSYVMAIRHDWPTEGKFEIRRVVTSTRSALWALAMPLVVLGGILGGIFTPTEAAAVAVAVAFFVGMFVYRTLKWRDVPVMLLDSMKRTSLVLLMVAGSAALGWYMSNEGIPQQVAKGITSLSDNKYVILAVINAVLLVLGFVLHGSAAMVLTVPIFMPLVHALGVDPVHFGVIMCINTAIGQQTPPVASVLLSACAVSGAKVGEVMRYNWWFILAMFLVLQIVTYVPWVSLVLPNLLSP